MVLLSPLPKEFEVNLEQNFLILYSLVVRQIENSHIYLFFACLLLSSLPKELEFFATLTTINITFMYLVNFYFYSKLEFARINQI